MTTAMTEEQLLAWLELGAAHFRPRLFAVYGVSRRTGEPFLGWGLDFDEGKSALFLDPDDGGPVQGSSAEGVLGLYQCIAEARLKWLDADETTPASSGAPDQGCTT